MTSKYYEWCAAQVNPFSPSFFSPLSIVNPSLWFSQQSGN